MYRPHLYRSGTTKSPNLHVVRKGKDIQVDEQGRIILGSGGMSMFLLKPPGWKDETTWILPDTAHLNSGIQVLNDRGNHKLISPYIPMAFHEYVNCMQSLNGQCQKLTSLKGTYVTGQVKSEQDFDATTMPCQSNNRSKAIRFVYEALAAVYQDHSTVSEWDENDYAYIGVLAAALNTGGSDSSSGLCTNTGSSSSASPVNKEQVYIAQAVTSFMKQERDRVMFDADDSDFENFQAIMDNDHALLRNVVKLEEH